MTAEAAGRSLNPLTGAELKLVFLLAAINFTHILDFVIIMPLGDQLREELGITPSQFGLVVSVYGISAMVSGIIASTVIDRFDRRTTMLLSLAGFIVTTVYCGLAPDYWHLLAARALAGLCGGVVASTVMAFVVDLIPDQRRGRAIGIVSSSFAFASTIGLPIGLTIANWAHRFGAPFLGIAALGTVVWIAAMIRLPTLPGTTRDLQVRPLTMFVAVVRQANHLWSFAFMLTMIFGTFMIVPFIAPYLEANCGLARKNLPIIYAVAGVCSLIVMNISGWATDRFGPRRVFICAAGSAVVMTIIITNLPVISLAVAVLVTSLFMSVASSRMVPAQAMMLRSADPKARGAFTSLNSAVAHFATGVAPLISGTIIGELSPGGPLTNYWIVGVVAVCFGVAAIALSFALRTAPVTIEFPS
jgi:predicted MFS family arabinose efflux permease